MTNTLNTMNNYIEQLILNNICDLSLFKIGTISTEEGFKFVNALKSNTSLNSLTMSTNIEISVFTEIMKALYNNCKLRVLIFSSNHYIDDCIDKIEQISKLLEVNSYLEILSLHNHNINSDMIAILVESLNKNVSRLKELYLDDNNLGSNGGAIIAKFMITNKTIVELDLSDNKIDDACIDIAKMLYHNTVLQGLSLDNNIIDSKAGFKFAKALRRNSSLTSLNLCNAQLSNENVVEIAKALCVNTTLKKIDLGSNNITSSGAIEIANMLKINKSLQVLELDDIQINKDAVIKIAKSLKNNKSLRCLYLRDCCIDTETASKIAKILESNYTLKEFYLPKNYSDIDLLIERNIRVSKQNI